MQNVTLIGIDLGKHSFHVHCQDQSINQSIKALLRKKLTRTKLIPVFYEDEVDIDLNLNPKIGADWCMKGQQKRIATHRGRIKNTILQEQSIR